MNDSHPLRYGYKAAKVLYGVVYYFGLPSIFANDNAKIGNCEILYSIIRVAAGLEPLYMSEKYGFYPEKPQFIEKMKEMFETDESLVPFMGESREVIRNGITDCRSLQKYINSSQEMSLMRYLTLGVFKRSISEDDLIKLVKGYRR